ncbi:MAG: TolC family outer membrane protein [Sideroxyarcus sp.]|nr:TolC family outer membrane protein [Sideroxyarcus sp.]
MLVMSLVFASPAWGLGFKEAVERALSNDPTFLAAQANRQAAHERVTQAASDNFIQGTISASTSNNRREYTTRTTPPPANVPLEAYNMSSAQLSFTQPLWRHSSMIAFTKSKLGVEQADYELNAAGQDVLIRLTQAWLDIMQARDDVQAAEAQVRTAQQQLDLSQRANAKGILSLTGLEEARSKHDQAVADLAVAQSDMEIRLGALEQIIGPVQLTPPKFSEQYPTPQMGTASLEQWLTKAETNNPGLLAAQRALEAANEEVRKQQAGHEPTLDLVASYGKTSQAAGITGGQAGFDSYVGSVGLQFNMPLSVGGGQSAKVREALAMKDKALQELEAARRQARMNVKQAWYTWRASTVREASAHQAVLSAELNIRGAQSARDRGVKADIDVLQAEQQHAIAQRDWRKARYDSLLSQLKLQAACGQLDAESVIALGRVFEDN